MKAIQLHRAGRSEALHCEDAPIPSPNVDEVLVRVAATAITPTEFDWYPTFHTSDGGVRPFPIILGHEFSGVIETIGSGCTGVHIGEPVYGLSDWFIDGAQAEYCVTVPSNIASKPSTLDHITAAVVPISALTAWQALIDRARISEGQRVLIHGGAGSVGSFAIQLAHQQRAHVITTASAANGEFLRSLGADEVIDYRTTRFEQVVRNVDVVLDTVGGDTRDRSWDILRAGGRLVTIAADAEGLTESRVREAFFIVEPNRAQLIKISHLIDTGVLRPVLGQIFPMDDFRQAFEQKPLRGKNVLAITDGVRDKNNEENTT